MTKAELIANMRRDRARLDELLAPLDDARMIEPGLGDGWSVKDHLSHMASWERMIVAHLRDGSDHEVARMDEGAYTTATLDELNERLHQLQRDAPVTEVRKEFVDAHLAIVAFIDGMPEEQLARPYWDDWPEKSVLEKIAGDTYLHYREHAAWIAELIGQAAEAP